jgi:hypothetical protein
MHSGGRQLFFRAAFATCGNKPSSPLNAKDDHSLLSSLQTEDSGVCFIDGTVTARVGLVWPLTVEAISLGMEKKYDAEQRLHRHVTRLIRRRG